MSDITEFNGPWAWLSNFYPCDVILHDIFGEERYPSVEHAYQAAKTTVPSQRATIQHTKKPGDAKRLGRGIKLREGWEELKFDIMLQLLRSKFNDPILQNALLGTSGTLVEGNYWHDNIWGKCYCSECYAMRRQPDYLDFTNHLGKFLMQVREEIRSERRSI